MLTLTVETGKSQWGQSLRIVRGIVREEGNYSALYRGLIPNLMGNSVSWGLYFLLYLCVLFQPLSIVLIVVATQTSKISFNKDMQRASIWIQLSILPLLVPQVSLRYEASVIC
jgi:hypothetical protein